MKVPILLILASGLIIHVYIVFTGTPEIFWIVDLQTALVSAVIEMMIAPLLFFFGIKKAIISLHDRQRTLPKDLFKDENQLW